MLHDCLFGEALLFFDMFKLKCLFFIFLIFMTKTITYPTPISDVACIDCSISLNALFFGLFEPKYLRIFLTIQAYYRYLLVGKLFFISDKIHHSGSSLMLVKVIDGTYGVG